MTIIFNGNDYKYELESIVKLFFPAQLFNLLYDERNAEGDLCFTQKKQGKNNIYLFVYVRLDGKVKRLASHINSETENLDNACELEFARLLYLCLESITGITPEWGVITGIRPIKRVNKFLADDYTPEQIEKELRDKYLVSKNKINLALKTAKTQEVILKNIDKNSFSLYVSIPFCPTRCSYCSFVSQTIDSVKKIIPQYVDNLCEEIKQTAIIAKELNLKLDTVYFGGGTPTAITAQQLDELMKAVSNSFDLSKIKEYTVEAGRADTITREKLEVIINNGATRISINPQTLNDEVLKVIGRKHTVNQVLESFELAREIGFDNINMDLIAGLPTDTIESFKATIDKIISLNPENVTVHTLSIKRAADLNRGSRDVLENPAPEMVSYASEELIEAGYLPYYLYRQKNTLGNLENIGYSKKGKESLYNIFIMEEIQTILATGAGASTKLVIDGHIDRIFNYKHPLEYNNHFGLMLEKKKAIKKLYHLKGRI